MTELSLNALKDATIVFDLDGTLVDTAPDLADAMNAVLASLGRPPATLDTVRHLVGLGARRLIAAGLDQAGAPPLDDVDMDAALEDFLRHYEANIAAQSQPFPGAETALAELDAAGARLAICTNKPERLARLLLDALDLSRYFRAIIGADTFSTKKPFAEPYLGAVARAGGAPESSLMVGDSETDVKTAAAAARPVIVMSFGYSEKAASELGGDVVLDDYVALPQAAAGLLRR